MEAALDPEELAERGMLVEYAHPAFGRVRSIGLPLSTTGFTPSYRAAPGLGADGADLLRELGFPDDWLAGPAPLDGERPAEPPDAPA
jgi:crotonobetainyl-CoA:carnitine CoA-transferase CaiB-like acyl-CoA transferase